MYQVQTIFWHNRWNGAVPHASNRMKRSTLQKKDKTWSILGCVGVWKRGFLHVVAKLQAKSQKIVKSLFVLQFWSWDGSFRHGEMKIWLCLYFQQVTRYIGTDSVEENRQNMQRSKKEHFLAKGALIGESMFQIQRISAVHGRCSNSGVLRDIPPNFTRSGRRRIVL